MLQLYVCYKLEAMYCVCVLGLLLGCKKGIMYSDVHCIKAISHVCHDTFSSLDTVELVALRYNMYIADMCVCVCVSRSTLKRREP